MTVPIQKLAEKLITLPSAVQNNITYQQCLDDILTLIQLHAQASNDLVETQDTKFFLGQGKHQPEKDQNGQDIPQSYSEPFMAKFNTILSRYTADAHNPKLRNTALAHQQSPITAKDLLTMTTPRNIFQTPIISKSSQKSKTTPATSTSLLPPRILAQSQPFDYQFNKEPVRSFENQNLFAYCGLASHILAAVPPQSITTINLTHPPPPTMDSYFSHHILDFKKTSLTDYKYQLSHFAPTILSSSATLHNDTSDTNNTTHNNTNNVNAAANNNSKSLLTIPTSVNDGGAGDGVLDPDSTLLSEHTLLLAARALKPKGNIFIMSDDDRVATFLDRTLTPHQESTPGCDRTVLELSKFFHFEELRLNPAAIAKLNPAQQQQLPAAMLASFGQNQNDQEQGGTMSRYQKMNQQGKIPNQKPHANGAKQRAWRLVRKDVQWE